MKFSDDTNRICQSMIEQMNLPENFSVIIEQSYQPLSKIIMDKASSRGLSSPLFVNVNGAQGTGKSTLTTFLKNIIESETGSRVAELSIDDFYLTRTERQQLSDDVHPLFITRGVPGTHDLDLIEQVMQSLSHRQACHIPRFDKAVDDRHDSSQWTKNDEPVDVILFEGWCNSSPVQSDDELVDPVNELEAAEDAEGIWRRYANQQLKQYHEKIFDHADLSIMLNAGEFERIYEWRSLQEEKLRQSSGDMEHVMNEDQLRRFIQHYERISRHTLNHLPKNADVVLPIAEDHSITGIIQKDV